MEGLPLNVAPRAEIVRRTRRRVSFGACPIGQPDVSWAHGKRAGLLLPTPASFADRSGLVSGSSITLADTPFGPMVVPRRCDG
jgi:hypothetical protein